MQVDKYSRLNHKSFQDKKLKLKTLAAILIRLVYLNASSYLKGGWNHGGEDEEIASKKYYLYIKSIYTCL